MSIRERVFVGEMTGVRAVLNKIHDALPGVWPDVSVRGSITPKQYWAGVALAALIQKYDYSEKSAALGEFTLGESKLGSPGGRPVETLVARAWEYAESMAKKEAD